MPHKHNKHVKKTRPVEKLSRFMYRNRHGNMCWGIVIDAEHAVVFKQTSILNLNNTKEERIIVKTHKIPRHAYVIHTSIGVPYLVTVAMDATTMALIILGR